MVVQATTAVLVLALAATARAGGTDLPVPPEFPPEWRTLEREIGDGFFPTANEVSDRVGRDLARQVARGMGQEPRSGPPGVVLDDSRRGPEDLDRLRNEQIAAAQARLDAPGDWKRVEVELCVDELGRLLDTRVLKPSGRPRLDAVALMAVRDAVARRPPRDAPAGRKPPAPARPGVPLCARVAFEAGVSVNLPRLTLPVVPTTGRVGRGAVVGFSGRYDDGGGVTSDVPLARRVHTRVTLLSLTPTPTR